LIRIPLLHPIKLTPLFRLFIHPQSHGAIPPNNVDSHLNRLSNDDGPSLPPFSEPEVVAKVVAGTPFGQEMIAFMWPYSTLEAHPLHYQWDTTKDYR